MFDSKHMAVCSSRMIAAPADVIFELLVRPACHQKIDGSGTVQGTTFGPDRLYLSARFGMKMKFGIPYRITNTVVEFEEGSLIAWRHFGGHIWRYRLKVISSDEHAPMTEVTECFDYSSARSVKLIQLMDAPIRNLVSIEKTLELIEEFVT